MRRTMLAVVVGLGLAAAPSGAATICVNPTASGGCQPTIQAAVNLAAPGDQITVGAGVYFENVNIPPGLDGLRIKGASKLTTILDPDKPNSGTGITVGSNRVTIQTLTIRNGATDGIDIYANNVVIQGLSIAGQGVYGIYVAPNYWYTQLLMNDIHSTYYEPILVGGSGSNNFGTIVKGNTITDSQVDGMTLYGDGIQVIGNKVTNAYVGIYVGGRGAVVQQNTVSNTYYYGIDVTGDADPNVQRNKVTDTTGYIVHCTSCFGGVVAYNSATDTIGGYDAFYADADGPGLTIKSNVATRANFGFNIQGTGINLSANRMTQTTFGPYSYCFYVNGDRNIVTKNVGLLCGGPGFDINNANDSLIQANIVTTTYGNGYMLRQDIGSAGNVLIGNKTTGNTGQGFAVFTGVTNTVLTGNSASKTRKDFCDQGTGTDTSGGNNFVTTATSCPIDF